MAFLMNTWYVAAWDHELADGKLLARTILEKPVLLYRGDSGRVVALDGLVQLVHARRVLVQEALRRGHQQVAIPFHELEGSLQIECSHFAIHINPTPDTRYPGARRSYRSTASWT